MSLQETFEVHNTLNPLLWNTNTNTLQKDVRNKLIQIAQQFIEFSEIGMDMLDILIVGSNASYNYTAASDIDLHLITNFEIIDCSSNIVGVLINNLKTNFNSKYNIKIHGIEVELYVEDVQTNVTSNGIYSVLFDKWIKSPKKLSSIPQSDITNSYALWEEKIKKALVSNNAGFLKNVINSLYLVRKNSIAAYGEYGKGNQLFKELRNAGYVDALKKAYYKAHSDELSLESIHFDTNTGDGDLLDEASKNQLITKSKSSKDGLARYKNRVKSRVIASNNQYNSIDMNKLFKDNIFTVDLDVQGESDVYTVKVSFGGFLDILHDQINNEKASEVDLKMITRALITGFNRNDVYIKCNCPDAKYRFDYWQTKNDVISGEEKQNTPANKTNPNDDKGSACKHVLLVISNTSWLLKCANVVFNYVRYMKQHEMKLYQEILYPAIYQKEFEEISDVEVDAETPEELPTEQ